MLYVRRCFCTTNFENDCLDLISTSCAQQACHGPLRRCSTRGVCKTGGARRLSKSSCCLHDPLELQGKLSLSKINGKHLNLCFPFSNLQHWRYRIANICSPVLSCARILCVQLRSPRWAERADSVEGRNRTPRKQSRCAGCVLALCLSSGYPDIFFGETQWNPYRMASFSG